LFIQADLDAAKLGISSVAQADIPNRKVVRSGLHFILGFAVLIYGLFTLNWQPERAALAACVVVIVTAITFGYQAKRPSLRDIWETVPLTGQNVVEIILISAAAGIVIGILNVTGLSFNLTYALVGSLLREWLTGPFGSGRRLVVFNRVMALVLVLTAAWLLLL